MKFIGFWEFDANDDEKYIEKFRQMTAEREKGTATSPKLVFGPYLFEGERAGFSVYETDDPDKLMALGIFFSPVLTIRFVPIIESARFAELYYKMKQ